MSRLARITLIAALVAVVPAASADAAKTRWFHSPTGNIECELDAGGAAGTAAFCQSDSPGRSATLFEDGKTKVCKGQKCLGNGPENATTLAYGSSITVGPFRCTSKRSGMRCVVRKTGRGYVISTSGVRTF